MEILNINDDDDDDDNDDDDGKSVKQEIYMLTASFFLFLLN